MSKSREQINKYLSEIDITGKTVLDVGVQNNPAKKFTKGEAKEYKTLDVDEEWGADYVLDLNDSWQHNGTTLGNWDEKFDVVFCLEVMEHIWNPMVAVYNLSQVTKEGGVCYISVPFINPIHDKWDFLRYTPEWFEKVLPEMGFKKVEVLPRWTDNPLLRQFYAEEGMRMSKIRLQKGEGSAINLVGLFIKAYK